MAGAIAPHAARIFQTNRAFESEDGPIAARTLGLVIGRHIEGGLHEDIDITNNSQTPGALQPGDRDPRRFRRHFRGQERSASCGAAASPRRGRTSGRCCASLIATEDFCREVIVRTGEGDGEPAVNANGRLSFDVALKAGQAWHRCLIYDLVDGVEAHPRRRENAPFQRDIGPCRQDGRMAAHGAEDQHQQRGILSLLQPGRAGHGRPAAAAERHRSHGVRARRRAAMVRGAVRPRHADRLVADDDRLSGIRRGRAGGAGGSIRRRSATTIATPSRARSCTSCATGSSRISS